MQTHLDSIDSLLNDFQLARPTGTLDSLWAFNEFSSADFKDLRLTRRLQQLARDFSTQPMASIPQASEGWAPAKAAYRFCSNPKVGFENILAAHQARTLERVGIQACPVVLCPQDTSTLNYLSPPATQGLGPLGTKRGHSLGLMLHSTLALDPQGRFFGLLGADCWARPKGKTPRRRRHQKESILKKERARWLQSYREVQRLARLHPQHLWVSVTDREGDIYEVFNQATGAGQCAGLLVRARHERSLMDYPRVQRALAIDMVVAWRIMDLNKAARLEPQAPADKWLERRGMAVALLLCKQNRPSARPAALHLTSRAVVGPIGRVP